MTSRPITEQQRPAVEPDDNLSHIVCECNEDVGLCGEDLRGAHTCPEDLSCGCCALCLVCDDLVGHPCRFCGG